MLPLRLFLYKEIDNSRPLCGSEFHEISCFDAAFFESTTVDFFSETKLIECLKSNISLMLCAIEPKKMQTASHFARKKSPHTLDKSFLTEH